jgi:hypothetical protein
MSDADRIQEGRPAGEELPAGARLQSEEYRHPTSVDLVRLVVYEQPGGFLVTEERVGSATVVATLGSLPARADAAGLLRLRAAQLESQGFARVT